MPTNIALEFPTNIVKAVRCHSPVELFEVGRLLLNYHSNPVSVFDLVSFGDIDTLTASVSDIAHVPDKPTVRKENGKTVILDHVYEKYEDREDFVNNNRTSPSFLFLYSFKTNRWEFFDRIFPHVGWSPLTDAIIK